MSMHQNNTLRNNSPIFIGDIHGNTKLVTKLAYRYRDHDVIQVGDFGVGFGKVIPPQIPDNARFIRGNHDNLQVCLKSPNYIDDGSVFLTPNGKKIMFIGGAHSIDKDFRTEFVDWWPDEECGIMQWHDFIVKYDEIKPDAMVTHDIPHGVSKVIFGLGKHICSTRTSQALDVMFDIHKPSVWVHGHWHETRITNIHGCKFHSLGIDEWRKIEL